MKKFILMLMLLSTFAMAAPIFNPATNHWYQLVSGNWQTAENNAIALGGHLVTINDAAEQAWLVATFGNAQMWIGFNDLSVEGTWRWTSGEAVTYTAWGSGEPNNSGEEDVAVINWSGNLWNDLPYGYTSINVGIAEVVPEPATIGLIAFALSFFVISRRKK